MRWLTLALGIGLNTAIFSLINDLFLRGLPFQEPERVVHILTKAKDRTDEFPISAPRYMLYRDGQTIFDGFAAENRQAATVTGLGDPLSVPIFKVTANWFDVLGVRPILGRNFLPEEEEGADVAMITERFWKARFAGSPNMIGRTHHARWRRAHDRGRDPEYAGLLDGTQMPKSGRRSRLSSRVSRTNG